MPTVAAPPLLHLLDQARPQAVVVFTDTFDHLRVVEACAARGIPVMMEKPLAVSVEHARAIERAARKANIPVMVNYETTWYASNRAAWMPMCRIPSAKSSRARPRDLLP